MMKNEGQKKRDEGITLGKRDTTANADDLANKDSSKNIFTDRIKQDMIELKEKGIDGMKVVKNKRTGKAELHITKGENDSSDSSTSSDNNGSSDSDDDSESIEDEKLKKIREKQKNLYESIKLDGLEIKKNQEGSNNEAVKETRIENRKLLSSVELKRYRFLQNGYKRTSQDVMLDKLESFRKKISGKTGGKANVPMWMKNKLKFHVDSANAFNLQANKEMANESRLDNHFQRLSGQGDIIFRNDNYVNSFRTQEYRNGDNQQEGDHDESNDDMDLSDKKKKEVIEDEIEEQGIPRSNFSKDDKPKPATAGEELMDKKKIFNMSLKELMGIAESNQLADYDI